MTERPDWAQLPMYELSDELAPRVDSLGLRAAFDQIKRQGYAVTFDSAALSIADRLRAAILHCADEDQGSYFDISDRKHGTTCESLLGRDPVFAEAVLNERVLALVEAIVGRDFALSQVAGSVRHQGAPAMTLHADQDWIPEPFPAHVASIVAGFMLEDIRVEDGPTKIIPGSNRFHRRPTPDEAERQAGAIPLLGQKGSIGFWPGDTWHANYPRTSPGDRVMLHVVYSRLAYRPVEDYSHLGEEFLKDHPPVMATLLGRNYYFGHPGRNRGRHSMESYGRMWVASRR